MNEADLQSILEDNRLLKERQETPDLPEALKTIPSLTLVDLEKEIKKIPLELVEGENGRILYHDLFTNGILYLDLGLDLHILPQELLPYAALFGRALLEMGTESEDFVKLSQRIGRTTGGIYPVPYTTAVPGRDQAAAWLFLRGKAITSKADELLGILRDVLLTVHLYQQDRFRQIVLEEKAGLEAQLTPVGHRMVNVRLRAQFGEAGWAAEQMGGISFLFFLRRLAEDVEKDWPSVLEKLETLRRTLVNRNSMICNVTVDADHWKESLPRLETFLDGLPERPAAAAIWKPGRDPVSEGLTIPAQVNYVGKGANLYELGYDLSGSISVINNFLRNSYLYERVRLQGGAYGVFPLFDIRSGVYTYLSYRDPNLLRTLETYDQTGQFLLGLGESNLSQDEIEKNIIGAIGDMDAYQLPDAKGLTSLQRYLANDTDEDRQRRRDQVLSTSLPDFHTLGEALERLKDAGRVVVLGSSDAIQAANSERPGWLEVQKVL